MQMHGRMDEAGHGWLDDWMDRYTDLMSVYMSVYRYKQTRVRGDHKAVLLRLSHASASELQ